MKSHEILTEINTSDDDKIEKYQYELLTWFEHTERLIQIAKATDTDFEELSSDLAVGTKKALERGSY